MASDEQLRSLFAEFGDHIASVLQLEFSQQAAALSTIVQREVERHGQSAGKPLATPGEGVQSVAQGSSPFLESSAGLPHAGGPGDGAPMAMGVSSSVATSSERAARIAPMPRPSVGRAPAALYQSSMEPAQYHSGMEATQTPQSRYQSSMDASQRPQSTFRSHNSAKPLELERSTFAGALQLRRSRRRRTVTSDGGSLAIARSVTRAEVVPTGKAWNPASASRMVYEAVSMLVALVDGIMIPYTLAWTVREEGAFEVMSWFSRLFWTADLLLSFATGYSTQQYTVELRLRKTARHFLVTWFLVDVTLVIWDWALTVLPVSPLIRVGRFVRMFRQVRRALNLARKVKTMFCGKFLHLTIDISILLSAFLWLAHVVCCGWYALGKDLSSSDTGETWLANPIVGDFYSQVGDQLLYSTAMHWSLTQFTPASMEVVPRSTNERIYNIAVIIVGFVVGSTLVATLSAMMTQYRLYLEESQSKMRQLNDYLDQERFSLSLSMAAKLEVLAALRQRPRLTAGEVSHLNLVSTSLQRALRTNLVTRLLIDHVFFSVWSLVDDDGTVAFCTSCVEDRNYQAGDICFRESEDGQTMFFVKYGTMTYTPGFDAPESSFQEDDPRLTCMPHSVAAEVAMWLKWVHLGTMKASTFTEALTIKGDAWLQELSRRDISASLVIGYAAAFHAYMTEPGAIVSDLTYCIDYYGLMFALPLESRMVLSEALLNSLGLVRVSISSGVSSTDRERQDSSIMRPRITQTKADMLLDEVRAGKTCVGLVDKLMVRFVFVVAMRVYSCRNLDMNDVDVEDSQALKDTQFLVKVGEVNHCTGNVSASCVLPGSKLKERETTAAAMERVIDEDLDSMGISVQWHPVVGRSKTRAIKDSPTYGIKTMYTKTLYTGFVDAENIGTYIPAPRDSFDPVYSARSSWTALGLLARSRVGRVQAAQEQVTEVLRGVEEVAVCVSDDRSTFYVWLLDEEFQTLEVDCARPIIKQWVHEIMRV